LNPQSHDCKDANLKTDPRPTDAGLLCVAAI